MSKLYDGIFVLHTQRGVPKDKGDWILHTPFVIEAVMQIALTARKVHTVKISDTIDFERRNGTKGQILFQPGPEPSFVRNKSRQLEVGVWVVG